MIYFAYRARSSSNSSSFGEIKSGSGNVQNNLNLQVENVFQIEKKINININSRIDQIGKIFKNEAIGKEKLRKEINRKKVKFLK